MDVTLSELLATFMDSPLVVWVSGSSTRTELCEDARAVDFFLVCLFVGLYVKLLAETYNLLPTYITCCMINERMTLLGLSYIVVTGEMPRRPEYYAFL